MVLADLGSKVAVALRKMTQATVVGAPPPQHRQRIFSPPAG